MSSYNTLQQMSLETNFSTIAKKSKYLFLLFTYFEIIIQKCNQLIINANNNIYLKNIHRLNVFMF